jgi:hypothetical protein
MYPSAPVVFSAELARWPIGGSMQSEIKLVCSKKIACGVGEIGFFFRIKRLRRSAAGPHLTTDCKCFSIHKKCIHDR